MNITVKLFRDENISYYGKNEITLDLEEYLRAVVASEIGNAPIQACAAQAIVSRTYALNTIESNDFITDQSNIHQAFRAGRLKGYNNAYEGVKLTKGQVLYYNGKLAHAYYSSSNGGYTTSSKIRWGGDYPYLISQKDEYDTGKGNGHGVGMSQNSAINRAKAGFGYQQILSFFFPNTEIHQLEVKSVMTEKEKTIVEWCKGRVTQGYIYGARGQRPTEAFIQQQYDQYPNEVNPSVVRKWIGKDEAWDCAQLVRYAMRQIGVSMVSGATSQWRKTDWQEQGTIDNLPENKVCCLYRQTNGTTMQHTGVYLGDGTFVDARGSKSGVLHSKINSYPWTHWGIPKGLYDKTTTIPQEVLKVLFKAKVTANSGSSVNMRAAASKTSSKLKQVPLGTVVDVVEAGNEWYKIVYEGITGFMMAEFLEKIEEVEGEYYVRIKCKTPEEAKRLAELLGTATAG